jgi:hypothetical protein
MAPELYMKGVVNELSHVSVTRLLKERTKRGKENGRQKEGKRKLGRKEEKYRSKGIKVGGEE